jgi:hypothetical protein
MPGNSGIMIYKQSIKSDIDVKTEEKMRNKEIMRGMAGISEHRFGCIHTTQKLIYVTELALRRNEC